MERATNALSRFIELVSAWIFRLGTREDDTTIMSQDF